MSTELASIDAAGYGARVAESEGSRILDVAPWAGVQGGAAGSFASLVAQGVDKVNAALTSADAALAQAAVDGTQPPHQVMLALEEARLSFQLALQVRNRLLEGYQELMRMQV